MTTYSKTYMFVPRTEFTNLSERVKRAEEVAREARQYVIALTDLQNSMRNEFEKWKVLVGIGCEDDDDDEDDDYIIPSHTQIQQLRAQAMAWLMVANTLDQLGLWEPRHNETGRDYACRIIRELAEGRAKK